MKSNEIRAALGLAPIVPNAAKVAKNKRNAQNRAVRGNESRELKAIRSRGRK